MTTVFIRRLDALHDDLAAGAAPTTPHRAYRTLDNAKTAAAPHMGPMGVRKHVVGEYGWWFFSSRDDWRAWKRLVDALPGGRSKVELWLLWALSLARQARADQYGSWYSYSGYAMEVRYDHMQNRYECAPFDFVAGVWRKTAEPVHCADAGAAALVLVESWVKGGLA
jgi:hypothetical protein